MGDVTPEMDAMETPRRAPLLARGRVTALLAALVSGLALLMAGCGNGGEAKAGHESKAPPGEIDLTRLSAQQLRPVGAHVDRQSIRVHPQVVRVAGVGTGGFISAEPDAAAGGSSAQAPSDAEVEPGGTAVAPVDAPNVVAAVIQAANSIARTPYKWGGGHGAWADTGYDCSGSVSFALAGAGLLGSPLDSTRFEHWGAAGPGRWITVYANAGHAFMVVAGLRFDTSGRSGPRGTRWQPVMRSTAGFVTRHPPGL